jgi:hypothetical protein
MLNKFQQRTERKLKSKRVNGEYVNIIRKHLFLSTSPSKTNIYENKI